jgi:hypothetical protein
MSRCYTEEAPALRRLLAGSSSSPRHISSGATPPAVSSFTRCSCRRIMPTQRHHASSRRRCLRSVAYVWRNWQPKTAPTQSGCLTPTHSTVGASCHGSTRCPNAEPDATIWASTSLLSPTHQWASFQVSDPGRWHFRENANNMVGCRIASDAIWSLDSCMCLSSAAAPSVLIHYLRAGGFFFFSENWLI